MGTHLNCIDLYNICLSKEKKYTGCNLKTTEFLDCVLIGVCAVIRSNTVVSNLEGHPLDFYLALLWLTVLCPDKKKSRMCRLV